MSHLTDGKLMWFNFPPQGGETTDRDFKVCGRMRYEPRMDGK